MLFHARYVLLLCLSYVISAGLTAAVEPSDGGLPARTQVAAPIEAADAVLFDVFGGVASTHILVKLDAAEPDPKASPSAAFQAACDRWTIHAVRKAFHGPFSDAALAERIGLTRTYRLDVPGGMNVLDVLADFRRLPGVTHAELDGVGGVARVVPDDPEFVNQWSLNNSGQTGGTPGADMAILGAWDIHTGVPGAVTLAIIDSGVSPHVDFSGRLISGTNTNDPTTPDLTIDGCPHGTHVAGIAAATGNNGVGIAGVNWGADIMPVRVLDGCNGLESQCAEGIVWATDHGADLCNISLQYYSGTQALRDAVDYAYDAGVLLVAAAGNFHGATVAYPAALDHCMAVSATDDNDQLYFGSNFGSEIDVSAPGEDVLSTWPNPVNSYTLLSGTSMASPHVAGLAALMKSFDDTLTRDDLRLILEATADDLGAVGHDDEFGSGRINATAALAAAVPGSAGACCGASGACFISLESACDLDAWISGEDCEPFPCPMTPEVAVLGGRYLEATPSLLNDLTPVAIAVSSPDWSCGAKYVVSGSVPARLQSKPVFNTGAAWGTVLLADSPIAPSTDYQVSVVTRDAVSPPATATTWTWGDLNQDAVASFGDIQRVVQVFTGDLSNSTVPAADLGPCVPNHVVNFEDILLSVRAFQGVGFDSLPCAAPCP